MVTIADPSHTHQVCCTGNGHANISRSGDSKRSDGVFSRDRYQYAICTTRIAFLLALLMATITSSQQFDAPYHDLQKTHAEKWAVEDQQTDSRLASLRETFGMRPNLVYNLANNIGYGELAMIYLNPNSETIR